MGIKDIHVLLNKGSFICLFHFGNRISKLSFLASARAAALSSSLVNTVGKPYLKNHHSVTNKSVWQVDSGPVHPWHNFILENGIDFASLYFCFTWFKKKELGIIGKCFVFYECQEWDMFSESYKECTHIIVILASVCNSLRKIWEKILEEATLNFMYP